MLKKGFHEPPLNLAKSNYRFEERLPYALGIQSSKNAKENASRFTRNSDELAMEESIEEEQRDIQARMYDTATQALDRDEVAFIRPNRSAEIMQQQRDAQNNRNRGLTLEEARSIPWQRQSIPNVIANQMQNGLVGDLGMPLSQEEIAMQAFNPALMGGKPVYQRYNEPVPVWATGQNTYDAAQGDLGIIQVPRVDSYLNGTQRGMPGTDNFSQGSATGDKPKYVMNKSESSDPRDILYPSNYIQRKEVRRILTEMAPVWWNTEDLRGNDTDFVKDTVDIAKGEEIKPSQIKKQDKALERVLHDSTQFSMVASTSQRAMRLS
jgi:hypothetical protein